MSALLKSILDGTAPGLVLFQVDQFQRMLTNGVLPQGAAVELIDGMLIPRDRIEPNAEARNAAMKARRAKVVANLQEHLGKVLSGSDFQVRTQVSVALGPLQMLTPDVSVFRTVAPPPEKGPPRADLALVVEVADTTLAFDRGVKGRVYALAGIPHFWIVNLVDNTVESYSGPDTAQQKFAKGEIVNLEGTLTLITGQGEPAVIPVRELLTD